ncbi:hypothetical protein ACP70R_043457 [Stipagrostis hirtigluma subsp. patula]
MESSAAGGDPRPRPSASGGASLPPPPPPPPPRGWLAGLVSGAGRLLAAVLGPDPSGAGSTATASDESLPSASCSPASSSPPGPRGRGYNDGTDHGDSPLFPWKSSHLNQVEDTRQKDYAGSLAIVSEIEAKDAIMQLLMQETYSSHKLSLDKGARLPGDSECNKFIKIIQERVLDPDSGEAGANGITLPSAQKGGRQIVDGYSSLSPNGSLPATSHLPIHGHGFDNSAATATIPTVTHGNQSPLTHNADNIRPVLKLNYSVTGDVYDEHRRVRPKINGNPFNISKFKQIDIIRNHPAANSSEVFTSANPNVFKDEKKLLPDVLGANNLTCPSIISKAESADEILDVSKKPSTETPRSFDSSSFQASRERKNYGATIFNRCSSEDLKKSFPLKVEPLNAFISFEQQMMDFSHRKEYASCDDSCSVSKLMLKEDIEAAPSLPMVVQLQNGSKNRRRRQTNSQKSTPTPTRSPAKGSRRKNNDTVVKSEIDLLEQSKLVLMEQEPGSGVFEKKEPELGDVPVKRPVGRPRKVRQS